MELFFDEKIELIQQLRLLHALAESQYNICVPECEIFKLGLLIKKFRMEVAVHKGNSGLPLSPYLTFDHETPITSIGKLSRPLILPHAITEYCKKIWKKKRKHRYIFIGFITPDRQKILKSWINCNISQSTPWPIKKPKFSQRIKRKVSALLKLPFEFPDKINDFLIAPSNNGRYFPKKSWDEKYYRRLANSQFVLCPGGVFPWTYRFFEAILCGAIPVVEEDCEIYQGFRYQYMHNDAKNFKWSKNDAEFNYELCINRITIPKEDLNKELYVLLHRKELEKMDV